MVLWSECWIWRWQGGEQLCSEATHTPFLGPSLPRDISSLFAMSLFPWSTFVFILDLTFTVFPVCHKGPPKGHGLPLGSLCYGLKTLFMCRWSIAVQICCHSGQMRPLKNKQVTRTCSLSYLPATFSGPTMWPWSGVNGILFLECSGDNVLCWLSLCSISSKTKK